MKHGVTLAAIALGFLMSSGVGATKAPEQICPNGESPCPPPNSGNCCSSIHLEAHLQTTYELPKNTAFKCKDGLQLQPIPKSDGYFVCKETEAEPKPHASKPEKGSKK